MAKYLHDNKHRDNSDCECYCSKNCGCMPFEELNGWAFGLLIFAAVLTEIVRLMTLGENNDNNPGEVEAYSYIVDIFLAGVFFLPAFGACCCQDKICYVARVMLVMFTIVCLGFGGATTYYMYLAIGEKPTNMTYVYRILTYDSGEIDQYGNNISIPFATYEEYTESEFNQILFEYDDMMIWFFIYGSFTSVALICLIISLSCGVVYDGQ